MEPPAKRRKATTRQGPGYARDSRARRSTSSSQVQERQTTPPRQSRTATEVVEDLEDLEVQQTIGKSPSTRVAFGGYRRLRQTTLLQRYVPGRFADNNSLCTSSGESQLSETDSDAEEDARIERSMGVIRKKTATRGTEGGTKYHCDVCSVDVTSTVSDFWSSNAIFVPIAVSVSIRTDIGFALGPDILRPQCLP